MISNKRTTNPTVEPVTVDELDSHLRGDGVLASDDGDLLTSFIVAAREYVEEFTQRALISQTWTRVMDSWSSSYKDLGWWDGVREGSINQGVANSVELPVSPLISVVSVETFDSENNATTFSSSNYFLDTNITPGQIILNTGAIWPLFTRNRNGIKIIYIAGYGSLATDVPGVLKIAVKQLAAHWYENREFVKSQSDQNQAAAPLHIQSILNRYQVRKL